MMIDWTRIDDCFFDMDGTLLDLHFDNHFWLTHVPRRYAEANGLSFEQARADLLARYRDIEGTLSWYCVDHWSRELGLDIALLKQEVDHLIAVHPHVTDLLEALGRQRKRRVLVTNAHQKSLALKLERTCLAGHFESIICAHDLGLPKEDPGFWHRVHAMLPFDPAQSLFVDDNMEVLRTAQGYGFAALVMVLKPDSSQPAREAGDLPAVTDLLQLMEGLETR